MAYIEDVSAATERTAAGLCVGIGTMRNWVMKIKDRLNPNEQSGLLYCIPRISCPCNYPRQTERMIGSRIHEHDQAVRRGDALSKVAVHTYETGNEFNLAAAKIITHTGKKTGRELIEAESSDDNSVNRSINLASAYTALRRHSRKADTGD
ncbi:unnamed protein product [Dibothriocephalus latus]|uniref:Uncharacterized protein n=1 Tax=Dibothriocephalus latus TaxID=60516 RepID=A0A3P7LVL7_DIBLA|nr:unnamed protein product [Dibothriocephalus latus]